MNVRLLLAALTLLSLAGCGNLQGLRLLTPEWSGLEKVEPDLYVEVGMPAGQRAELLAARDWAHAAVAQTFGTVTTTPTLHACFTEACGERFGSMGARAKVYAGRYILLTPRGLDRHYLAHEWTHAEFYKRLTLDAYFRVPSWFDEGLAVSVSEAPANSEAHWQYLIEHNIARPGRDELLRLTSLRRWLDAVQRYGETQNRARIARGETPIAPVYTAAGHELRPWLAQAGREGLLKLIERVNAGEDFMRLYDVIGGQAVAPPVQSLR